mmetsp:Transcript_64974/g.188389  ORF Transcript_64974/g.188389 Transcript_64974/m.188389 type:complete len:210 (-) Transcript_64974:1724-2353(-)
MGARACTDGAEHRVGVAEGAILQLDVLQRPWQGVFQARHDIVGDHLLQARAERRPNLLGDPCHPAHVVDIRGVGPGGEGHRRTLADLGLQVVALLHLELKLDLEVRGITAQRRRHGSLVNTEPIQDDHEVFRMPQMCRYLRRLVELQEAGVQRTAEQHAAIEVLLLCVQNVLPWNANGTKCTLVPRLLVRIRVPFHPRPAVYLQLEVIH